MTDRELLEKIEERYDRMRWLEDHKEENKAAFIAAIVKRGCEAILSMYILGEIDIDIYARAIELSGKVTAKYRNNKVFNDYKVAKF